MRIKIVVFAALLVLCAGCEKATRPPGQILIWNEYGFDPAVITVSKGTKVTWINMVKDVHAISCVDHSFESGNLAKDSRYSLVFNEAGTFNYCCSHHPETKGKIIVQ